MDALRAIDFQHKALVRMLAALFAMAGIVPGGEAVARLPRLVRKEIQRVLLPIESAARRLIFFVKERLPAPSSASIHDEREASVMKKQSDRPRKQATGMRAPVFSLFDKAKYFPELSDPCKRFSTGPGPRILSWDDDWSVAGTPVPESRGDDQPDHDSEDASKLCRRMQAVMRALGDMQGQARRLQQIMETRKSAPPGPKRRRPIRPGWPPGRRANKTHEVDEILSECARMASRVPPPVDTS